MECVAYLRVSTEKQAEEGNGLDSQRRDIEIFARKNELIIDDWYVDDGYTGANMNRPQLQRLISDCMGKRIKNVIAFKLDRLSRSMVDGLYMIEKIFQPNGVTFQCVHDSISYDSPMEQAYTQMMAVFAQLDKNTMMLRMRGGMLERVKQGYWMGGGNTPYCYSYNKELGYLVPIPERAEQARNALDLFIQGYSDVKIQNLLGYKNELVVRSILTGPVNIGMIPYKGGIYQGKHEPIFDKEKFDLAQELRKSRRLNKSKASLNLLSGLCYCGICGCSMRYQKWNKGRYRIYCCSRSKALSYLPNYNEKCSSRLEWADEIEKEVEKKIIEISLTLSRKDNINGENKMDILSKQVDREKGKLKRLYELYSEGNDTVIELIREKESEIADILKQIDEEQENKIQETGKDVVYENVKKIADVWWNISKEGKNAILKSIIKKIVVCNGNIDIILQNF